MLGTA